MGRKRFTAEYIIRHLRQSEVLTSQGRLEEVQADLDEFMDYYNSSLYSFSFRARIVI